MSAHEIKSEQFRRVNSPEMIDRHKPSFNFFYARKHYPFRRGNRNPKRGRDIGMDGHHFVQVSKPSAFRMMRQNKVNFLFFHQPVRKDYLAGFHVNTDQDSFYLGVFIAV